MTKERRRLFFDIETSPNIGMFWTAGFKKTILPESIIKERAVICVAWKFAGNKRTRCISWDKNHCDKAMLEQFVPIMESADEIVAHNGTRFDTPWLRTRCMFHDIPMAPDFMSLDTLTAARSKFYFNSNRLDYIAGYLQLGQKRPTTLALWKAVMADDSRALRKMMDYCRHDVVLLEQVFDRMNQYIVPKTSIADIVGNCPECGSNRIHIKQHKILASGYKKTQLKCQECGKHLEVASSRIGKEIP